MKDSLQIALENAKSLFQKGSFEAARKQFFILINANYEPIICHYYLGLINLNIKNYDEATNEFSICLKSDPHNVNYLHYLGTVAELQDNNDLALHYYYKTLKENPAHVNSKKAIERLNVVHREDFSEQVFHQDSNKQNTSSTTSSSGNINKAQSEPIQLYDQLLRANDSDSQIAVQMIKATAKKRRARLRAFIGIFFLRVIILPAIITFFLGVAPIADQRRPIIPMYSSDVMLYWYIFFVILFLIYHIIWVKSTVIIIDRGLIEITKGVFSRRKQIFMCHKADHFGTHQNFLNLITGDCTLLFDLDTGHDKGKLKITGLGTIKEINRLAVNLQNLRYQLRNTPAVRSGIYG